MRDLLRYTSNLYIIDYVEDNIVFIVILRDISFKEGHARFTTIHFQPLYDRCGRYFEKCLNLSRAEIKDFYQLFQFSYCLLSFSFLVASVSETIEEIVTTLQVGKTTIVFTSLIIKRVPLLIVHAPMINKFYL